MGKDLKHTFALKNWLSLPSVALISSLHFHNLGTQQPHEVWILLPSKARKPKIKWPPIKVMRTRLETSLTKGVEVHHLSNIRVPITIPARTVADCFKYRNQIGLDVCLEALKELLSKNRNILPELTKYAKMNRVQRIMLPYMEAII